MKKLIPIFLTLLLAIGCKDKCQDSFCPAGMTCVDGQCKNNDGSCPDGLEGDACNIPSNKKFAGTYNVTYTGSGGLNGSDGNTTAKVSEVSGTNDKIRVDVELALNANVLGQGIELPLKISVVGNVDGDEYHIPNTTISTEVTIPDIPFPIPIDITFQVDGELINPNTLKTTLTMSGSLAGVVDMVGTK